MFANSEFARRPHNLQTLFQIRGLRVLDGRDTQRLVIDVYGDVLTMFVLNVLA